MKKVLSLALALTMIMALFAGCGSSKPSADAAGTPNTSTGDASSANTASPAEKVEWKQMTLTFTTFQPETGMGNKNMYLLQDKLNEKMDGAIQLEYYYSGTLVSNVDTLDGVISGVADIGYVTTGNYPGRLPYTSLFDQCGIRWNNTEAASSAMQEFLTTWEDVSELDGVTPILYTISTPGIIASNKSIKTLDELQGVSCRSTSTTTAAVTAMGATPMTLEWGECYEALRNGMVDALYTIPGACASSLIHEVAPYALVNPYYVTSYMYVMNTDTLNSMPDAQRELFLQCCAEVQDEFTKGYAGRFEGDAKSEVYFANLEELNFLSDEDLKALDGKVSGLISDYATSLDAQGLKGTEALEYIKTLADKYNAMYPADDYNAYLLSWFNK